MFVNVATGLTTPLAPLDPGIMVPSPLSSLNQVLNFPEHRSAVSNLTLVKKEKSLENSALFKVVCGPTSMTLILYMAERESQTHGEGFIGTPTR